MFWAGRVNAVLAIATFGGVFFIGVFVGPAEAAAWFFFMIFVRVSIKIVDVLWTAVTGNPLVYQVKVLDPKRGRDGDA